MIVTFKKFSAALAWSSAALALSLTVAPVGAEIILDEEAIEAYSVALRSYQDGRRGSVTVQACPKCPTQRFVVDENTRVIQDGKEQLPDSKGGIQRAAGIVIYNTKTKIATSVELIDE